MNRDATGFWLAELDGARAWFDDPNVPMRAIVERATNRFQAYQREGDDFLSMGYPLTRKDVRAFLQGRDVVLYAEFGAEGPFSADLDAEPLSWSCQTLTAWTNQTTKTP